MTTGHSSLAVARMGRSVWRGPGLAFYTTPALVVPAEASTGPVVEEKTTDMPYRQDTHGPIYCLNSLSKVLYWAQHGPPRPDDAQQHQHHRSLRYTLIGNIFRCSVDPVAVYHVRDQHWRKRVGLPADLLPSCLQGSRIEPAMLNDAIQSLAAESVSWKEARLVHHNQYKDSLADIVHHYDKVENLQYHFAYTLAQLHDPASPIRRFVCLDIEAYEHSSRKLTEFGLATYCRDSGISSTHHIIIQEHYRLRNRRFAPDAKDCFAFGESITMSTGKAMAFLHEMLRAEPGTALVGHALKSDLAFLRNAKTSKGSRIPEDYLHSLPHLDVQHLFQCREGRQAASKLEVICEALRIPTQTMHNAGNDAALTLVALLRLLKIGPFGNLPEPLPPTADNESSKKQRKASRPRSKSKSKSKATSLSKKTKKQKPLEPQTLQSYTSP